MNKHVFEMRERAELESKSGHLKVFPKQQNQTADEIKLKKIYTYI